MAADESIEVTVELAASKLAAGLREYATSEHISCGIAGGLPGNPAAQKAEIARRQTLAADLARQLESATDDAARLGVIKLHGNTMANMDTRGVYMGPWAHVARMVACGQRHVISGGVLCAKVW